MDVKLLQWALLAQGYRLPRFGADGVLGDETRSALEEWREDHPDICPPGCSAEEAAAAALAHGEAADAVVVPPLVLDVRVAHGGRARRGTNPWGRVDTVCLHQMACCGPGTWQRWKDLAAHFAVLRTGQAAWLYDCNVLLWHGHGWNGRSVGIEVEGWFAGVEGRPWTLWVPQEASEYRRTPMVLPAQQAEGARQAVRLAVAQVRAHGGRVLFVAAHRQSCAEKASDPGELVWREAALPVMAELGLSAAPTLPGGSPIPEAWDRAQDGVPY